MSMDMLREAILGALEKQNIDAMTAACSVRPNLQTTADGLAMTVVDQLAMARAFAMCRNIVDYEYKKLVSPPEESPNNVRKIREAY